MSRIMPTGKQGIGVWQNVRLLSGTIWISVKRTNQHKQVTFPENNMFAENQSKKLVVEPTHLKHIFFQIGSSSAGGRHVKNVLGLLSVQMIHGSFLGRFLANFQGRLLVSFQGA